MIKTDVDTYLDEYHKHWMHYGVKVDVPSERITQASILKMDSSSGLILCKQDDSIVVIPSEGYSFDIERNCINIRNTL